MQLCLNESEIQAINQMRKREETYEIFLKGSENEEHIFIHSNIGILNSISAAGIVLTHVKNNPHVANYNPANASRKRCYDNLKKIPQVITNIIGDFSTHCTFPLFTQPPSNLMSSFGGGNDKQQRNPNITLIIIPHCKVLYWKGMVEQYFNFKVKCLNKKRDFSSTEDIDSYDIILCNVNKLESLCRNHAKRLWNRVIIDEVQKQRCCCGSLTQLRAKFVWYVREKTCLRAKCFRLCGYAQIKKLSRDNDILTANDLVNNFTITTTISKQIIQKTEITVVPDSEFHRFFNLFSLYGVSRCLNVNNWSDVISHLSCNASIQHYVEDVQSVFMQNDEDYLIKNVCNKFRGHISRNILLIHSGYILNKFLNSCFPIVSTKEIPVPGSITTIPNRHIMYFNHMYRHCILLEKILTLNKTCVFCCRKKHKNNDNTGFICSKCEIITGFTKFNFNSIHKIFSRITNEYNIVTNKSDFFYNDEQCIFKFIPSSGEINPKVSKTFSCMVKDSTKHKIVLYVSNETILQEFRYLLLKDDIAFVSLNGNVNCIRRQINAFEETAKMNIILLSINQPSVHLRCVDKIYLCEEPFEPLSNLVARTITAHHHADKKLTVHVTLFQNELLMWKTKEKSLLKS